MNTFRLFNSATVYAVIKTPFFVPSPVQAELNPVSTNRWNLSFSTISFLSSTCDHLPYNYYYFFLIPFHPRTTTTGIHIKMSFCVNEQKKNSIFQAIASTAKPRKFTTAACVKREMPVFRYGAVSGDNGHSTEELREGREFRVRGCTVRILLGILPTRPCSMAACSAPCGVCISQ